MNTPQLEKIVKEYQARLFDYQTNGFLVFDVSGKYIFHIPQNVMEEHIGELTLFLKEKAEQETSNHHVPAKKLLFLDTTFSLFESENQLQQFTNILQSELEHSFLHLKIHFLTPPDHWRQQTETLFQKLQKNILEDKNLRVIFSGTFGEIANSDKQFLFDNHVHLEYLHELADESAFSPQTKDVVTDLTEFGFQVPFVWYVNQSNLSQIPKIIDEAMFINYHSGFMLPTVDEQKELLVCSSEHLSPTYEKYLTLLSQIYKKYPYYDDILYPLNVSLYQTLPDGLTHPLQRYFYDTKTGLLKSRKDSRLFTKTTHFFARLFLWQRWTVYQTCKSMSTSQECSCQS
ncbi:MAG: hypothetical protein LBT05_01185 [Planctomycetaceae bacterium]|jgi:hypothetical protein|nr:hypothetical protein [Planctomycetaceae bacterium]